MNRVIWEWINKAEADYRTAERELAVKDGFNYDAVCFHAQQCIEKLMKALLIKNNIIPPKTHDLTVLQQLIPIDEQEKFAETKKLRFLNNASVSFRYPGESADLDDAKESFQICREFRLILHNSLDISDK